jgi:uncharacterized membrane protein
LSTVAMAWQVIYAMTVHGVSPKTKWCRSRQHRNMLVGLGGQNSQKLNGEK